MSNTKHTQPLAKGDDYQMPKAEMKTYGINTPDHGNAIEVYGSPDLRDHIIKCVNMHDELVEIVGEFIKFDEAARIDEGYNLGRLLARCAEVLSRAKE